MLSDIVAKTDGRKPCLRTVWPKSSEFGPKSDELARRILNSKNGIGQVKM